MNREAILTALSAWVRQRPGLEYGNYGNPTSYRAEMRRITRQRNDALTLLRFVALRESITAENLADSFRAYSGRLTWTEWASGEPCPHKHEAGTKQAARCGICCGTGHAVKAGGYLDYCAGQYWPTEYRAAACAVLAQAVWGWLIANAPGEGAAERARKAARFELGRGLAARWLS